MASNDMVRRQLEWASKAGISTEGGYGYVPTVWQAANFAGAWFADAANEATVAGAASRRREILFAVAAAEAFIYEWTRTLVLGTTIEQLHALTEPEISGTDRG